MRPSKPFGFGIGFCRGAPARGGGEGDLGDSSCFTLDRLSAVVGCIESRSPFSVWLSSSLASVDESPAGSGGALFLGLLPLSGKVICLGKGEGESEGEGRPSDGGFLNRSGVCCL